MRRSKPLVLWLSSAFALAEILYHGGTRYLDTSRGQAWGSLLFLGSLLCALWLVLRAPQNPLLRFRTLVAGLGWLWLVLLLATLPFRLGHIRAPHIHMDEAFWILQAKAILHLKDFHPSGFIGDQPANFHAWPVALILAMTHDPYVAVRLTGILYLLGATYFLSRWLFVAAGRPAAVFAALFSGFSLWAINLGIFGWNNVTIVPLLTIWPVAKYVEARRWNCERSLLWSAIALGFAVSTLYVPLLLAILLGPMVCLHLLTLPRRLGAQWLLVFALVTGPTIGKCIQYPGPSLGRHVHSLQGGEKLNAEQHLRNYQQTLGRIGEQLKPERLGEPSRVVERGLWGLYLEPTTLIFLCVGVAAVCLGLPERGFASGLLFLATAWMLLTFVLSNPGSSIWRASGIQALLPGLAALGAAALIAAVGSLGAGPRPREALLVVILAVHLGAFLRLYSAWRRDNATRDYVNIGTTSRTLVDTVVDLTDRGYTVALPAGDAAMVIRAAVYRDIEIKEYQNMDELERLLMDGAPMAIGMLPEVQNPAEQHNVQTTVSHVAERTQKVPVRDSMGRLRAILFLVSRKQ